MEQGTAQRTVKIGTIMDLQITVPDLETQNKAAEIDALNRKRKRMYRDLVEQEQLLTDRMIKNIISSEEPENDHEKRH